MTWMGEMDERDRKRKLEQMAEVASNNPLDLDHLVRVCAALKYARAKYLGDKSTPYYKTEVGVHLEYDYMEKTKEFSRTFDGPAVLSLLRRLQAAEETVRQLAEMERRLADYESIMNGPVGNAPDVVAEYFINNECLWYPGTRLCAGFKGRLVSVIKRARLDGAATYHEQKDKQASDGGT